MARPIAATPRLRGRSARAVVRSLRGPLATTEEMRRRIAASKLRLADTLELSRSSSKVVDVSEALHPSVKQADLVTWLDPWPISISGRYRWQYAFMSMRECTMLRSCWDKELTFRQIAPLVKQRWGGHDHQIASLARHGIKHPAILVVGGVVYDGNHRLLALMRRKYRGPVLVFFGEKRR